MLCSIHNKQYTEERERLILYSQLLDADELLNAISSPAKSCDILNTTTNKQHVWQIHDIWHCWLAQPTQYVEHGPCNGCCRFAAVGPTGRRYRSIAARQWHAADECGQCHVDSIHRKLNTRLVNTRMCITSYYLFDLITLAHTCSALSL